MRNMFIKSNLLLLFLLLCSLLQSIRTAPEIQLHHLKIEPTDSNNLLKELIHYSSDTFSLTAASSLATIIRNQEKDHLQLMIQLNNVSHVAQVEKILGKELKHVIPPQTYIIHGMCIIQHTFVYSYSYSYCCCCCFYCYCY